MYIYESEIDIRRLRSDLMDYFGTAAGFMPVACADLISAENASAAELVKIAGENGFDIDDYLE